MDHLEQNVHSSRYGENTKFWYSYVGDIIVGVEGNIIILRILRNLINKYAYKC